MSKKIKFEARIDSFVYLGVPTLILDAPKPIQSGLYRITLKRVKSKRTTKAEQRWLDAEYE